VRTVFENDSYRSAAKKLQASIQRIDGLGRAADIIEDALKLVATTPR